MKTKVLVWFVAMLTCVAAYAADAPDQTKARAMLTKTHLVIKHAHETVKKSGKGKDDLRSAFVHQHAARSAMHKGKYKVAAHLTLKARHFAISALQANAAQGATEQTPDTKEETQAAEGAAPAEAAPEVSAAEKEVPPADDVVKQDVPAESPDAK
jgi:hypothetical protein